MVSAFRGFHRIKAMTFFRACHVIQITFGEINCFLLRMASRPHNPPFLTALNPTPTTPNPICPVHCPSTPCQFLYPLPPPTTTTNNNNNNTTNNNLDLTWRSVSGADAVVCLAWVVVLRPVGMNCADRPPWVRPAPLAPATVTVIPAGTVTLIPPVPTTGCQEQTASVMCRGTHTCFMVLMVATSLKCSEGYSMSFF